MTTKTDGATLVDCMGTYPDGERSRCRCVECGKWLICGWSYLASPVDGNYVECSGCRYNEPDASEYAKARGE